MGTLESYDVLDRKEVEEFLRHPTGMHLYLLSRLAEPGEGDAFHYRSGGRTRGFAWFGPGRNLVLAGEDAGFPAKLASVAAAREGSWLMVVGPWGPTSDFLDRYQVAGRRRPRLDRVQEYYVQTPETLPPVREPALDAATDEDLEELAVAAARMSAEDFEIDQWRIDRQAVRQSVSMKIRDRRSFLLREEGRLIFKVDVAVLGPDGGQVEGVFTVEDRRGRGIASRCVSELGHRMLRKVPMLGLHVAETNAAARRAYEKAGYRSAGRLRLAIFPPA